MARTQEVFVTDEQWLKIASVLPQRTPSPRGGRRPEMIMPEAANPPRSSAVVKLQRSPSSLVSATRGTYQT